MKRRISFFLIKCQKQYMAWACSGEPPANGHNVFQRTEMQAGQLSSAGAWRRGAHVPGEQGPVWQGYVPCQTRNEGSSESRRGSSAAPVKRKNIKVLRASGVALREGNSSPGTSRSSVTASGGDNGRCISS